MFGLKNERSIRAAPDQELGTFYTNNKIEQML